MESEIMDKTLEPDESDAEAERLAELIHTILSLTPEQQVVFQEAAMALLKEKLSPEECQAYFGGVED